MARAGVGEEGERRRERGEKDAKRNRITVKRVEANAESAQEGKYLAGA